MAIPKNIYDKDATVIRKHESPAPIHNFESGKGLSSVDNANEQTSIKPSEEEKNRMISNGGGFGNGVLDAGSFSSDPLKDPSNLGTIVRITSGGASVLLGKAQFETYGDPSIEGHGRAATGKARSIVKNPDPTAKKLEHRQIWKNAGNSNNDPYKTSTGGDGDEVKLSKETLPTSKWFSGVVVIDSLTMTAPSYTTTDLEGNEVEIDAAEIEIQNIMMNISQTKNIVRSRIAGRDGRVNQYINMDDYTVDCRGVIVAHEDLVGSAEGFVQGERPEETIRQFVQFMERPTQITVSCEILNLIGIERAIIADFKLTQKIGKLDNQDFSFKMWQDRPFEIFIEEKQ